MKLFISADIEGTAGIVNWNETKPGDQYEYFSGRRWPLPAAEPWRAASRRSW